MDEPKLRELLDEAADWLCNHEGAKEFLEAHPGKRFWCTNCSNYVRSVEQATLLNRVRAALNERS